MTTYQVKLNGGVLFSGTLPECLGYMVETHGDETIEHIYNTGYRIDPTSLNRKAGGDETSLPVSGGRAA